MRYEFVGQYNKKDLLIFEDDGITLLLETPDLIINKFFPYGCLNSIKSLRGGFEAKAIPGHGTRWYSSAKRTEVKGMKRWLWQTRSEKTHLLLI